MFSSPWINPATRLCLHVSPLVYGCRAFVLCSVRAQSEWTEIWRRRRENGNYGQVEGWVFHSQLWFTMCTDCNITHMHHNMNCPSLWECVLVWFQMYGFTLWGSENVRRAKLHSIEWLRFQCRHIFSLYLLLDDSKRVQIHFCWVPFTQRDCDQWHAHTFR